MSISFLTNTATETAMTPRYRRRFPKAVRLLGTFALAAVSITPQIKAQNSDKPTVAVMYFTNSALVSAEDYAPLSKGMAEMLITELSRNTEIRVVERERLQSIIEEQDLAAAGRVDAQTAAKVGKILGARHMLMGTFVIDPRENMRIDVRAVNTETSQIEYVETIEGKASKLLTLVSELGAKVNNGLKLPARPAGITGISDAGGKNPNQFRAMLLMSRAIEEQDKNNVPAAVALYKEAIDANPDFERAKTLLASLESGTPRE